MIRVVFSVSLRSLYKRVRSLVKFILLAVPLMIGSIYWSKSQVKEHESMQCSSLIVQYIQRVHREFPVSSKNKNALVFLLRFIDFGCVTCLNNFLDYLVVASLAKMSPRPATIPAAIVAHWVGRMGIT